MYTACSRVGSLEPEVGWQGRAGQDRKLDILYLAKDDQESLDHQGGER